jgi:glycosyltransferase involved in cell wall biosynthesis
MISVIVPYNKDRGYLKRCIDSINSQTGVEFEVIESFSQNSWGYNFNRGLERAKGEFCKFVAEDDYLPPSALHSLNEGIGDNYWIFANAIQEESTGRWVYRPGDYSREFHTLEENLRTNRIHGGTTLYRTDVLRGVGGADESLWTGEEYDMHLKLWSKGFVPGYINREVYVHTLWGGQKSRQYRRQNKQQRDEQIKKIQARYHDPVQ